MNTYLEVTTEDGKYTVRQDSSGATHAFRYGEEWRDCTGDGLIYSLACEVDRLLEENKRLTELLDANTVHSCGDHCQRPTCKRAMRNAIECAHEALIAFNDVGNCKAFQDLKDDAIQKLKHFIQ